jgi:membrane AbrB-like protein
LPVDLKALAVTLAIGGAGGFAAHLVHLSLGFLLGSLIVTAILAVRGIRPLGLDITLPARLRFSFVPVIGVAIGGAFTPHVAGAMAGWWPSLVALSVFVPLAHGMGYLIYRRGGLDPVTALYGAVPGGLIESVQMGEEAGADPRLLTLLQFLRLILTILTVPMIFLVLTGHSVGSASGAQMVGAEAALTVREVALMNRPGFTGV